MFNNDSKVVYYVIAGVGILVSAAAIYYFSNSSDDSELGVEFQQDIKEIGEIKMVTENNVQVIQFNQFIHVTKVIYKCHEKLSKRLRDKFDDERRSLYLKKDWAAYDQYVCDQHNKDGKALDDIIAMILRDLNLKQEVFDFTLQYYQNDPISYQALANSKTQHTPKLKENKPKMTREQTLEYFTFLESEKTRLLIEAVKNGVIDQLKNSTDTQASDNFMAIQSARAFDKLAIEKRVYETEYMDALAYYKVDSEPEAIKIMQQNFLQLQAARESNPPRLSN